MGWVGRLFDARDTFVRMLLVCLSGVGYLTFGTQAGRTPTPTQWLLAVLAFAAALLLHKRPVVNLLAQTVLLALALFLVEDSMINQVGASWALLELAMWARTLTTLWWGFGLVAAVYLGESIGDPPARIAQVVFGLAVVVGVPVLLGLVIRTTRELSRQAEAKAAEEQLRRESESRAARADERTTIARELHDVVAHHVASMVLRVGVARHVLPDVDPRVGEVFDDVHSTGTTALADLRRLVAVLRDPEGVRGDAALTAIDPGSLPAALDGAVETARRSGLIVDADVAATAGDLDAVRSLAILRLTQEALTNVAKHAGAAAHVRFSVRVTAGNVIWEVADDGGTRSSPLPAAPALVGGGHGLTGMRERVEVLGGELEAGPWQSGWRVRTVLPGPTSSASASSADAADAAGGQADVGEPARGPAPAPGAASGGESAAGLASAPGPASVTSARSASPPSGPAPSGEAG
jgi:signal transduction histidine kinase